MSNILAISYDDAFVYTKDTTLSSPAAGFMSQTSGTLTLTTARSRTVVPLQVNAGVIYPIPFVNISLNGTNAGPLVAFVSEPFRGTT